MSYETTSVSNLLKPEDLLPRSEDNTTSVHKGDR